MLFYAGKNITFNDPIIYHRIYFDNLLMAEAPIRNDIDTAS